MMKWDGHGDRNIYVWMGMKMWERGGCGEKFMGMEWGWGLVYFTVSFCKTVFFSTSENDLGR